MSRHVVCAVEELGECEARRFDVEGHAICVVRFPDKVYAIGDTCSHADISLSEGEVNCDDHEIECWKHGSAFSLRDGEPQTLPATRPVPVYDAFISGDDIVVVVS
jgi:3-phenylpropionate/trans-cinnamate dioxygenase ferredoxin component